MYSPGEGRDESAFNLPAINFNRIPGCCTAWTPRLFSASPSPLSPISTTCVHMQSLSECAMSFLLGSAASFTVDWFLFRSRGQANGVGNGPDVRCMVDSSAAPGPRALAAGRGTGPCWPCPPPAPLPAPRFFVRGGEERGITPAPSPPTPARRPGRSRLFGGR
ncbi:uncharacterized protein LOC121069091 isoform X2 [Cygnus olor]|uniref:uncharacterized protein LOC121069091 isoform X2 n=1 Tax=Cygnus olor TaxID=8869 RepID=UPI001ADEB492|nr:uncharacterized protein LOC121069091 isoform X2 [Cygnus olor]